MGSARVGSLHPASAAASGPDPRNRRPQGRYRLRHLADVVAQVLDLALERVLSSDVQGSSPLPPPPAQA